MVAWLQQAFGRGKFEFQEGSVVLEAASVFAAAPALETNDFHAVSVLEAGGVHPNISRRDLAKVFAACGASEPTEILEAFDILATRS